MAEKITSIATDQNEIILSIQKLSPKAGDVLMSYIRTDDVGDILEDKGVTGLFLMDKICLLSLDDAGTAIERLENCISGIREVPYYVPDIKNGTWKLGRFHDD